MKVNFQLTLTFLPAELWHSPTLAQCCEAKYKSGCLGWSCEEEAESLHWEKALLVLTLKALISSLVGCVNAEKSEFRF